MEKVKFFCASVSEIEKTVNDWLEKNDDKEIINREVASVADNSRVFCTVMIFYRASSISFGNNLGEKLNFEKAQEELKIMYFQEALKRTEGNKTSAAKLLGISFRSFRYHCKRLGIKL